MLSDREFDSRHNIKNVAKSIINIYNNHKKVLPIKEIVPQEIKETEKIFTNIMEKNCWGDKDSLSGSGSNLEQTQQVIIQLPLLLKKYNIKTMLDLPCGDFFWMKNTNLKGITYIGADIVPKLIEQNKKKYPLVDFRVLDIINSPLPKVDLIFCRDCFVHLPYDSIHKAIQNCIKSGSRYLLTTSFKHHDNINIQLGEYNWRPLNLEKAPFNLVPRGGIFECCTEEGGKYEDKYLLLFDLNKNRIEG
jgi:hypothetical protein